MVTSNRRTFLTVTGGMLATGRDAVNQWPDGLFGVASTDSPPDDGSDDPLVIGYYRAGSADSYPPEAVPYEKLTDVIYHGVEPDTDGTVEPVEDTAASTLTELRDHASEHGTRLHASVVHDTITENEFTNAIATRDRRTTFAESTADLVETHDLDGIDIDWEPQAAEEPPKGWTCRKGQIYLALLQACREHLDTTAGGRRHLTIAATDSLAKQLQEMRRLYPQVVDRIALTETIDRVHVMSYDYHGQWVADDEEDPPTGPTGFNAPLHSPSDSEGANTGSVAETLQTWTAELPMWADRSVDPTEFLITGLPFYGRSYGLVSDVEDDTTPGLGETFTAESVLSASYADIVQQYITNPDYERQWHHEALVPWLYSAEESTFVTYDDPQSISQKVDYTLTNGFAGVMIWALDHDRDEALLDTVNERISALTTDEPVENPTPTAISKTATLDGTLTETAPVHRYTFEAQAGQAIRFVGYITSTLGPGRITLFDPSNEALLNMTNRGEHSDPVPHGAVADETGTYSVRLSHDDTITEDKVYYDFDLRTVDADPAGENDDRATAIELEPGQTIRDRRAEADADWFAVTADTGDRITATLTVPDEEGWVGLNNVGVEIHDPDGTKVGELTPTSSPANQTNIFGGIKTAIQKAITDTTGVYYISVTDVDVEGFTAYDLQVELDSQPIDTSE